MSIEWNASCKIGEKGENAAKILMEQFDCTYRDVSKNKFYQAMDVDFVANCNEVTQWIEAKGRLKDYGDIGLELITNTTAKTPGWAQKSKAHIITYWIDSSRKMYVLDGTRQRAWLKNLYQSGRIHTRKTYLAPNYSNGVLYSHSVMLPLTINEADRHGIIRGIYHLNNSNVFEQIA